MEQWRVVDRSFTCQDTGGHQTERLAGGKKHVLKSRSILVAVATAGFQHTTLSRR